MSDKYLLVKRGLYWRPYAHGYTGLKSEAGRYDYYSAVERINDDVTMTKESDAPSIARGCSDIVTYTRYIAALEARCASYAPLVSLRERCRTASFNRYLLMLLTTQAEP